jgi:ElaB/YqjD/DUF883 family membrane-anchored ribosome-binding protein
MTIEGDVSTMPPHTSGSMTRPTGNAASTAKEETAAVGQTAKEAGREVMTEVSDQVSVIADTARDQINTLVSRARDELSSQGEARGEQAVSALQSFSRQFDALVRGDTEGSGELGTMVRDAQRRVQSYSSSLQARGPRAIVDDVSRFARRRPAAFLAAAGVAGFAIGRLVRSGAMQSSESSDADRSRYSSTQYGDLGTPLPPPDDFERPSTLTGQGTSFGSTTGTVTGDSMGVTSP